MKKEHPALDELSDYLWDIEGRLSSIGSDFEGDWGEIQDKEISEDNFNILKDAICIVYKAREVLLLNLSGNAYLDLNNALNLLNKISVFLEKVLLVAMQSQGFINSGFRENVKKDGTPIDCLIDGCNAAYKKYSKQLNAMADKVAGIYVRDQLDKQIEEYEAYNEPLTDTEKNILEALGHKTMRGAELLKKAGYENNSHFRQILSNLKKRNILDKNSKGYSSLLRE